MFIKCLKKIREQQELKKTRIKLRKTIIDCAKMLDDLHRLNYSDERVDWPEHSFDKIQTTVHSKTYGEISFGIDFYTLGYVPYRKYPNLVYFSGPKTFENIPNLKFNTDMELIGGKSKSMEIFYMIYETIAISHYFCTEKQKINEKEVYKKYRELK